MLRLSCGREERDQMTEQAAPRVHTRDRDEGLRGTETKSSYKTTELIVYVLAVLGVLIAALFVDGGADGFNTADAWRYVTYLTVGYMISRGLAKSGSRNPRDD
jgi:hypothetical protein